jgi:pre-60S factor REI1
MASLPPIPLDKFQDTQSTQNTQIKERIKLRHISASSSEEETSDDEDEESASPFQCLFCNQDFASDDSSLSANLEHMQMVHEMSIPYPEKVVDMESFVGYLATEVRIWHECLYCGATKPSALSIQSHMRDKGHCRLNVDREPELLDFWESPPEDRAATLEQAPPTKLSATEVRFASGRVIGSRHAASTTKKVSKKQNLAIMALPTEDAESSPLADGPQLASSRQLARREEMSLIGIPEQQMRALVLAEKKAQRSEAAAERTRQWINARGANSQKFDQLNGKMKHGKQNHKLMPR